jgi:hypothetical protein
LLEVCILSKKFGEQRLNELICGTFFGEGALFGDRTNHATIRAINFSELEMLDLEVIREMMKDDQALCKAIKAEARKNFVMETSRGDRALTAAEGLQNKSKEAAKTRANKMRRKKYGTTAGGKSGPPIDLLAEMSAITSGALTGNPIRKCPENPTTNKKVFPSDMMPEA